MKRPYEVSASKITKIGRFTVVQDTMLIGGKEYPYTYISEKDCSCVLPVYEDGVVVIRQYRHAIDRWQMELPTGGIDDGEKPEDAAKRELFEETGYVAQELTFLGDCYIKPGTNTGKAYFYLAKCENAGTPKNDASEFIETLLIPIADFVKMVEEGRFDQALGIVCWQKAKKYILFSGENC